MVESIIAVFFMAAIIYVFWLTNEWSTWNMTSNFEVRPDPNTRFLALVYASGRDGLTLKHWAEDAPELERRWRTVSGPLRL